eukprot:SAG11_NODE_14705_length_602_cov_1.540755_2_plen_128_part_01
MCVGAGGVVQWEDRFFYMHCCESYSGGAKKACFGEAVAKGIWKLVAQRPGTYDPTLRAAPWWAVEEMGHSAPHALALQSEWEAIRDEGLGVMDTDFGRFQVERAGLHAQRSWWELSLWAFGRRNDENC